MDKWVSVKERPPSKYGYYIVAVNEMDKFQHVTAALYSGKHFVMTGRRAYWKVTHWMPFPEPPAAL